MSYDYETQRPRIFTEDGVEMMMRMREKVRACLRASGAFKASAVMTTGDSWDMLAVLDYLIEKGEIRRVTTGRVAAQDEVYVSAKAP